jgi:hypothetical protein
MAHITDSFVQDFGTESVQACAEDPEFCIGEPLPGAALDPESVEVDGDDASAAVNSDIGPYAVDLVKEEDVWKVSSASPADDEIADGTEVVDLSMVEFAFEGDLESDAVKSGDFAFHISNDGDQAHEAILVELPPDGTIEELLEDPEFQPEPIFAKVPYGPGDESDVALPEPLAAGRYGLVCFFPDTDDPEKTPHAFLGMVAEFTVE